jgi:hypothetical protein
MVLVLSCATLAACGGERFYDGERGEDGQGGRDAAGGARTVEGGDGGEDASSAAAAGSGSESSPGGQTSSGEAGAGGTGEHAEPLPIAFVAADELNTNGKSLSVVVPAPVRASDLLLLFFSVNGVEHTVSEPSGVTGWILLDEAATAGMRTLVWSKQADAADAGEAVTIALSDYNKSVLTIAGYRGQELRVVDHASHAYADPVAAYTTPPLPNQSGVWLVSYFSHKSGSATGWQAPSGASVRSTSVGEGSGRLSSLLIDSNGPPTPEMLSGISAGIDDYSAQATLWSLALAGASD